MARPLFAALIERPTLAQLRDELIASKSFAGSYAFYLDFFADDPNFIDRGKRIRHEFVEHAVNQVIQKLYNQTINTSALTLRYIADAQFIHGLGLVDNLVITILYFAEVQVGLAIVASAVRGDQVHYARFGNRPNHEALKPSSN